MMTECSWAVATLAPSFTPRFCRLVTDKWGAGTAWNPTMILQSFDRRKRVVRPRPYQILPGYALLKPPPSISDDALSVFSMGTTVRLLRDDLGFPLRLRPNDEIVLQQLEASPPMDPDHSITMRFVQGRLYPVRQGPLAGLSLMCERDTSVGDSFGSFSSNILRVSLPLYFFAEPR